MFVDECESGSGRDRTSIFLATCLEQLIFVASFLDAHDAQGPARALRGRPSTARSAASRRPRSIMALGGLEASQKTALAAAVAAGILIGRSLKAHFALRLAA